MTIPSTTFIISESGAVTVDWVVLTAALVGLGLATMGVVSSGVEDTSGDIDAQLQSKIISTGFVGSGQHYFDTVDAQACDGGFEAASSAYVAAATDTGALHPEYISNAGAIAAHLDGLEDPELMTAMGSLQGIEQTAGGFENLLPGSQSIAYLAVHCEALKRELI